MLWNHACYFFVGMCVEQRNEVGCDLKDVGTTSEKTFKKAWESWGVCHKYAILFWKGQDWVNPIQFVFLKLSLKMYRTEIDQDVV